MHRAYKSPTVLDLEITDVCNEKCRHCLNFDRDLSMGSATLTEGKLDEIIDQAKEAGIFHVVLSGGEALVKFDLLEHGVKRLIDEGFSISVCSNLSVTAKLDDRMKRLADVGLDHILTSLISHDPVTCDHMVNAVGAFERICRGIETAVENGIRVSANMVVMQKNHTHVYDTAKLAHNLGCQKIFGTRIVAPNYDGIDYENLDEDNELHVLTRRMIIETLDQLIEAKKDSGIAVGTLVSYPLCLLGDMEKYADFVGRGCPTQRGHRMSILPGGDILACAHINEMRYGNVFETGLVEAYKNQSDWRDGSYHNPECAPCDYKNVCEGGCRVDAHAYSGSISGRDPLMVGPIINGTINNDPSKAFVPFRTTHDPKLLEVIKSGAEFSVPDRLRFRKEDSFYLMSIRWANIVEVETEVAEFLMKHQGKNETFTLKEFGEHSIGQLADFFMKDVVESDMDQLIEIKNQHLSFQGLSIDPSLLPPSYNLSTDAA